MRKKYTGEQFAMHSQDEILEITNGRAIDIRFKDGRWTQLCVNDLQGIDKEKCYIHTKIGIKIFIQEVDDIEVYDK